jgi:hypothetical protein
MRVWNWSVDTEDWKAAGSGAAYWVDRIKRRATAGGSQAHPVILMHNQPGGNPATVAALPGIISYYRVHRYAFVDLYGHGAAPSVTVVAPRSAPTAGGTRVKITGKNFRGVRSVHFGATAGRSVRVASSTTLYVTAPPHAAVVAPVRVTTTFGTSRLTTADTFRFVAPPTVTGVSPSSGATDGGTRVQVSGSNFQSVTAVRFGSVAGTAVQVTSTGTLYVTSPAHSAGLVNVTVTTAYGTSASTTGDWFTYEAPPPSPPPPVEASPAG